MSTCTGHAEVIRTLLAQRRSRLAGELPEALTLAARVLAAIHDAARGHAAALSVDRGPRHRRAEFVGERALAVEDVCAVALASAHGRTAVLAGLRELAQALGHELRPTEGRAPAVHDALARALRQAGELFAATAQAAADGRVEPDEASALASALAATEGGLAELRAALAAAAERTAERPAWPRRA